MGTYTVDCKIMSLIAWTATMNICHDVVEPLIRIVVVNVYFIGIYSTVHQN